MAANTVWGLDIGNSAIKAVKMVRSGDGCKIVDFDIIDIPHSEDDKDRPARVRQAMQALTTNKRFGNDVVYVAVSSNVCLHREFQLPPGSEDKLDDLVQYEAKQQIPFPLDQVEWGYERYDDPAGVGVAMIAVRKNDIQDLLNLTKTEFKLNVCGITASPLALFNFIEHEFKPENTTLILDAGAKTTDFVVMNKRQVYFRTIQIAGREITRALENKLKVPYEKAEEIKKNIGESKQQDKILNVIEPTLRQLGAEIQRTIGFYKAKARGRVQSCYLLGHTFRLPKMGENLQTQVREAPFVLVEGLQHIKCDPSINMAVWENEFPTMAVAVGLGLQGLGLSELKLNLIPKSEIRAVEVAAWKGWMGAAAVVMFLALAYSYAQAGAAVSKFESKKVELDAAEKDIKKYDEQEKNAIATLPERELAVKRLARVEHDRGKEAQAFARLCGLKGADGKSFFGTESKIYLTSLYVSRIPFGLLAGTDSSSERGSIAGADALKGKQSIYAPLSKGADPATLVPELRPDIPMVVVLSGEVEGSGNDNSILQKLGDLAEVLKKIPEVKDLAIPTHSDGPTRTETLFEYDHNGVLKGSTEKTAAGDPAHEKKYSYTLFNVMFRWDDSTDLDLVPVAGAAVAPAAVTKKPAGK